MSKLASLLALLLSLTLVGCEDAETVTLRVTMDVEASGTPYSSSTVVNMRYSTGYTFLKYAGYTLVVNFGGHAPYVRIGETGVLFFPFNGGQLPQVGLRDVIHKTYKLANSTSQNTPMTEHLRPITRSRGVVSYPLDDRMTPRIAFIYLPDRMTPTSARRLTTSELAREHGIAIKTIRIEAVSEQVTNTIQSIVPWIDLSNRNQQIYKRLADRNEYGDNLINIYTYNLVGKL